MKLKLDIDCKNGYSLDAKETKAAIQKVLGKMQISVRPQDLKNLVAEAVQDCLKL